MKIAEIETFFQQLDRRIDWPIQVLITGGAAAILFGGSRATQDIDFEVKFKVRGNISPDIWPEMQKKMEEVSRLTGISAQYSDDIDRWSSIRIPDKKSGLYKKIGKIEVRILAPGLWAIGKLSRYLSSDTTDLVDVFTKTVLDPMPLAKLWGKALGMSPPSPSQSEFRRHVDHFLNTYAVQIWGKKTDVAVLKEAFLKSAQAARR